MMKKMISLIALLLVVSSQALANVNYLCWNDRHESEVVKSLIMDNIFHPLEANATLDILDPLTRERKIHKILGKEESDSLISFILDTGSLVVELVPDTIYLKIRYTPSSDQPTQNFEFCGTSPLEGGITAHN